MTLKVLLVEDQKPTQVLLAHLLADVSGYEVVGTAPGETQATDWVLRHPAQWDLAIVDLLLEEGSGFSLIKRLKHHHADGACVVFSDFTTPAVRDRCLSLGADHAISKADFPQLRQLLEQLRGRTSAPALAD